MSLKDNGNRTNFESGAVREVLEDNGRCDLLPLDVIAKLFKSDPITEHILTALDMYIHKGYIEFLYSAVNEFMFDDKVSCILDVSKHYKEALVKYPERNWEKGLPSHSFIDSGVRHLMKYLRGDTDEPHGRAFLWNMLGLLWNDTHHPELVDLPFVDDLVVPNRYRASKGTSEDCSVVAEHSCTVKTLDNYDDIL